VKAPNVVVADIERRLAGRWHEQLAGDEPAFPHAFPIGKPSAAALRIDYGDVLALTLRWQDWARSNDVVLVYENREARGGSVQQVPTHARIESIDHAARIVSGDWPLRLEQSRHRVGMLRERFPRIGDLARGVRLVSSYSDVDFDILLTVADWFQEDPARAALGVTPRQVPIPGVHAKWLQAHQAGVKALTGFDDLGILPGHEPRIHFTYLDPDHRASGGRVHDSATVRDSFVPAYLPEVVVISENKDTAIGFLPIVGGISVEGVGKGGKTPAAFSWIKNAPVVIYWGDIDRDGFEILDGYRADFKRDIDSILMDPATYGEYEVFGTNLDQYGKLLSAGAPKDAPWLHGDERETYHRVLSAAHTGHRRVEQERIPLQRAREMVQLIRERASLR